MKHHAGIILLIDRKELIRSLYPANMPSQLVPTVVTWVQVNKLQLSLSSPAADLLEIPLQVFGSSSVAPPHIFRRRLLVHTLLRHGHHQPRPVCVCVSVLRRLRCPAADRSPSPPPACGSVTTASCPGGSRTNQTAGQGGDVSGRVQASVCFCV